MASLSGAMHRAKGSWPHGSASRPSGGAFHVRGSRGGPSAGRPFPPSREFWAGGPGIAAAGTLGQFAPHRVTDPEGIGRGTARTSTRRNGGSHAYCTARFSVSGRAFHLDGSAPPPRR